MIIEIKVPSPGESITQVQLATWLISDGKVVEKDAEIAEIDSDKATLSIPAEEEGKVKFMAQEGDTLEIGAVMATIDTSFKAEKKTEDTPDNGGGDKADSKETVKVVADPPPSGGESIKEKDIHLSPLAKKMLADEKIDPKEVIEHYGSFRISRKEVSEFIESRSSSPGGGRVLPGWGGSRDLEKKKMSTLRIKLSERLVSVKNETAMLTTFNEVNMTPIMNIRKQYKEIFKEKHGVSLGFMSFFTKAVTEALNHVPAVNAQIDGDEVIYYKYADIGIAVSAPKGLVF